MSNNAGRLVERRHRLDPRPQSARLARQAVLGALVDADRTDLADAAKLLVTELVTNAIVHARTTIDLEVVAGPDGVRVAVHDGNPNRPTPRHYGASATTGRGLELVEQVSDRHGTESDPDTPVTDHGKTVWFELGTGSAPHDDASTAPAIEADTELTVHLPGFPVSLGRAWQQHADALLRELLLSRWDEEGRPGAALPGDDAAANDAFSIVAAALEALGPFAHLPSYVDVVLPLRHGGAAHFAELDRLLDHASALAERGQTLAAPSQPEFRLLRRWICEQVRNQASGLAPRPWPEVSPEPSPPAGATGAVLAGKRAELEAELAHLSAAAPDAGGISFGKRVGDATSVAVERLAQVAAHQLLGDTLAAVRRAQDKLDDGTYGRCDGCERPISEARLEALPWASTCIACAARR